MTDTTTTSVPPVAQRQPLEELTPADIRRIGAQYRINMTGIPGTTWNRVLTFIGYAGLLLGASWFFVGMITEIVGFGTLDSWLIILAGWTFVLGSSYKIWLVNVPKLTALITTDKFTKEMHVWETGFGLKRMWETYDSGQDYIDLQADLVKKTSSFLSKDGIPIEESWSLQFTPFTPMLPLFIRTENTAIEDGMAEVVEGATNTSFLTSTAEKVRSAVTIQEIRQNLLRALEGDELEVITKAATKTKPAEARKISFLDAYGNTVEQRFGLKVELDTFSPPKLNKDYADLLMASVKRAAMMKDAHKLAEKGMGIDHAMRQIMIMNNEPGVTDQSFTLRADENAKELGEAIAKTVGVVGPLAGAVAQGVKSSAKKAKDASNTKKKEKTS